MKITTENETFTGPFIDCASWLEWIHPPPIQARVTLGKQSADLDTSYPWLEALGVAVSLLAERLAYRREPLSVDDLKENVVANYDHGGRFATLAQGKPFKATIGSGAGVEEGILIDISTGNRAVISGKKLRELVEQFNELPLDKCFKRTAYEREYKCSVASYFVAIARAAWESKGSTKRKT